MLLLTVSLMTNHFYYAMTLGSAFKTITVKIAVPGGGLN